MTRDILKKCIEGENIMSRMNVVSQLWHFMRENKKFWLAPILIVFLLISVLLIVAGSSALAPFIYTLF